jgi:hypothetical protein
VSADRGDGQARARHARLRPDEAGRTRRSAHGSAPVRGRPAAPGGQAGRALQPGRIPDQAAPGRAEADPSHAARRGAGGVSRAMARCTATPT